MQGTAQTATLTPFGKYLLDEEIARGGMARVYLARLRGLGGFEKKLVVKQILPELARDPRFVSMFVEEAKTLVQMSHPNIVPVYELGIVDGVYFLAMEYVEGATLAEMLGGGPLSPPLAAHVGGQVCDALAYAHDRFGLVHRDVTPRNVIVDALGNARLLDFGIAARVDDENDAIFGSHGYMSPEQARGDAVSATSDLFSFGTVLHEALTGAPAFLRGTPDETRAALLAGERTPFDEPKDLAALVGELCAEEPSMRPASASSVSKRLRGYLSSERPEGVAAEVGARAVQAVERRKRTPSRRPPSAAGSKPGSGSVREIATSMTLRALLAESGKNGASAAAKESPEPVVSVGTVPIRERTSAPNAEMSAPDAGVRAADEVERERKPSSNRAAILVGALVVIAAVVAVWPSGSDTERRDPHPPGDETAETSDVDMAAEEEVDVVHTNNVTAMMDDTEATPMTTMQTNDVQPARPTGRLTISANPWGDFVLNRNTSLGRGSALRDIEVPAGPNVLKGRNPELQEVWIRENIVVPEGESVVYRIDFNESAPRFMRQ